MNNIKKYIHNLWDNLRRYPTDIKNINEEKFKSEPILYIPNSEDIDLIKKLTTAKVIKLDEDLSNSFNLDKAGLLYLPKPYIVPGGRFNEVYGWDTYFINKGLLEENMIEFAEDNIENLSYQIKNYGKVLNGNRSYYLSRSNPPLFSQMILEHFNKTNNIKILEDCIDSIVEYFNYWRSGNKYKNEYNLSRYYSENNSPAFEVYNSYEESENQYFENIKNYYRQHPNERFYNKEKDDLTDEFYLSDRSMRESGFDISNQFGEFSSKIIDNLPVCLNSMIYVMANDISKIYMILSDDENAIKYQKIAEEIKLSINKYLWVEDKNSYFHYDFHEKENNSYLFCTCFMPLWAKVASREQATKLVKNILPVLEKNHGIVCSEYITNMQWDAPYGWAPLNYFVVQGLLNYGYEEEAYRIMKKWVNICDKVFEKEKTLKEKYVVDDNVNDLEIKFGYSTNEDGFGWSNGVYLYFTRLLEEKKQL